MAELIYKGQLMKKGKINKGWKNRWCIASVIQGDIYLQYYDSKISSTLCGSINFAQVYDIKIVHSSDYTLAFLGSIPMNIKITNEIESDTKYTFILYTHNRKWIFAAFDPKNFIQWLNVFDKYIYDGIIKKGLLQKRGERNRAWKQRYFLLNKFQQLRYYKEKQYQKLMGTISLNEVIKIKHHSDKDYTFQLLTRDRTWILSASTSEERREWMELLNKCRRDKFQHKTFSLFDQTMETFNIISNVECMVGNEGNNEHCDQWKCSFCLQTYATMWTKCPGCLMTNTHCISYISS
eukprot:295988_1